jgi:nucleoside-diphosphate-sugar epimerase
LKTFVTGGSGFLGRELIGALVGGGHSVRALARSEKSAAAVQAAGAEPVLGDLDSVDALRAGMQGCDWVFHAAAHAEEWDSDEVFHRINVVGTDHVLEAARAAQVRRVVHISSESAIADGRPMVRFDETRPYPANPLRGYPATKGEAERRVRAANGAGLETVVVRPRLIWGRGDTSVLVKFLDGVDTGRMKWVGQGRYLTSTCHVANVCEGALLAAERGKPGEVYFLTDGEPVEFRGFLTSLVESQGRKAEFGSVPYGVARAAAAVGEAVWRALKVKTPPPATKIAVGLMGHEMTVVDEKARRELGYAGKVTVADGLAELARLPPVKALPR